MGVVEEVLPFLPVPAGAHQAGPAVDDAAYRAGGRLQYEDGAAAGRQAHPPGGQEPQQGRPHRRRGDPACYGSGHSHPGTRGRYDEHLAGFPALAASLSGPAATQVRGAGPLRQRVRRRTAGRVLLVGDAAGYVDALTGEGIALALATAGAAAWPPGGRRSMNAPGPG
ncbi:hypothetical protein GCM10018773_62190 [Streptomyces candidus]|nr:hypothetical protein GCM10018773_62190 [Streptomyces candidus]